ncbi:MAG: hypothetical protein WC812_01880 [Candidatus Pacearchaeota archaeon]|jgi:hypothetical protein
MRVRTKKQYGRNVLRLETSGKIQEVILNEDFLKPKNASVSVCFRGEKSAGIVDLSVDEIENLYKEVSSKMKGIKKIKVMKFKK